MGRPRQFDTDAAIDKAMAVFWQSGYAATSPQMLISELGIGKGSLYNTFESKHKLFTLSLTRYTSRRVEFLTERFAGGDPVRFQLQNAVEVLTGHGEHRRGCLVVNASAELGETDAAVGEIAEAMFESIEASFRQAIQRGQAAGELDAARDASSAASSLLATVVGTSLLLRAGRDEDGLARTIDATIGNL